MNSTINKDERLIILINKIGLNEILFEIVIGIIGQTIPIQEQVI